MYYFDRETNDVIAGWLIDIVTTAICAVVGHKKIGSLVGQERGLLWYRCWRCGATGEQRPGEPIQWNRRIQYRGTR